jgi:hypothetical protein
MSVSLGRYQTQVNQIIKLKPVTESMKNMRKPLEMIESTAIESEN